jgi:hypothetical protein
VNIAKLPVLLTVIRSVELVVQPDAKDVVGEMGMGGNDVICLRNARCRPAELPRLFAHDRLAGGRRLH